MSEELKLTMSILDRKSFQAILGLPTGERVSITSKALTFRGAPTPNEVEDLPAPQTFYCTATDVFLDFNGVTHRLFVDLSKDLGKGIWHIWLTDGPAVINDLNATQFDYDEKPEECCHFQD